MSDNPDYKQVRSKITHKDPGLTKGKVYTGKFGFYRGGYVAIKANDRGEPINIYDWEKYLEVVK